jgi:hypothetical protein
MYVFVTQEGPFDEGLSQCSGSKQMIQVQVLALLLLLGFTLASHSPH